MGDNDFRIQTESYPRIQAGDTYQFVNNVGPVPVNSVFINIFDVNNTLVHSALAVQSGTSNNYYGFYTTSTSLYMTVNSSGIHLIEWIINRDTGNDSEKEYFEIIKLDEEFT